MSSMQHPGLPVFLKNTPSMICDQVLWLVKNSNLNFQLKETPYSLNLSIKKVLLHSGTKIQTASKTLLHQSQMLQYFLSKLHNSLSSIKVHRVNC